MPLKRGDSVTYVPFKGCSPSEYQRGIVKKLDPDGVHVFVLYHTRLRTFETHDLDHYTAARTRISDLLDVSPST